MNRSNVIKNILFFILTKFPFVRENFLKCKCNDLDTKCTDEIKKYCYLNSYIERKKLFVKIKANDPEISKYKVLFHYIILNTKEIFIALILSIVVAFLFLTDTPLFLRLFKYHFNHSVINEVQVYYNEIIILIVTVVILIFLFYLYFTIFLDKEKELVTQIDTSFVRSLAMLHQELTKEDHPEFKNIVQNCANYILDYFSQIFKSKKLGCTIRIVKKDRNNFITYVTCARVGVSPERLGTTEPLDISQSVPKFFSSEAINIHKAIVCNDYPCVLNCQCRLTKNKNHDFYKDEEKSILIIPIYSSYFEHKLYGLIFISSKEKNAFIKNCSNYAHFISKNMSVLIDGLAQKLMLGEKNASYEKQANI